MVFVGALNPTWSSSLAAWQDRGSLRKLPRSDKNRWKPRFQGLWRPWGMRRQPPAAISSPETRAPAVGATSCRAPPSAGVAGSQIERLLPKSSIRIHLEGRKLFRSLLEELLTSPLNLDLRIWGLRCFDYGLLTLTPQRMTPLGGTSVVVGMREEKRRASLVWDIQLLRITTRSHKYSIFVLTLFFFFGVVLLWGVL